MTGRVASSKDGRTVRVDPHVHTVASYDGHATPEALLERAETVGLDGIVITDHDTVEGAHVAMELADRYDPVVIPGCEVSTADGHLLALGVEYAPEPGRPLAETAADVQACGGLVVVPHPFQRARHGASRSAIQGVDGVEVHNALTLTNFRNSQAARFARRRNVPRFGGSDAHRAAGVGRSGTAVRIRSTDSLTPEAILAGMRSGRTAAVGRRASAGHYLAKVVDAAKHSAKSLL